MTAVQTIAGAIRHMLLHSLSVYEEHSHIVDNKSNDIEAFRYTCRLANLFTVLAGYFQQQVTKQRYYLNNIVPTTPEIQDKLDAHLYRERKYVAEWFTNLDNSVQAHVNAENLIAKQTQDGVPDTQPDVNTHLAFPKVF